MIRDVSDTFSTTYDLPQVKRCFYGSAASLEIFNFDVILISTNEIYFVLLYLKKMSETENSYETRYVLEDFLYFVQLWYISYR